MNVKLLTEGKFHLSTINKKESIYNVTVRFSSTTTFRDIKKFVCEFWVNIFFQIFSISIIRIYLEKKMDMKILKLLMMDKINLMN